jgi:hypothetical protein
VLRVVLGGLAAFALSVTVQAQELDEERLELAREMITLNGAEQASTHALEQMLPTMRPLVEAQYPNARPDQYDAAMSILTQALMEATPHIVDRSAQIYARRFTADELRALNDFYRSEVGRRLVEEQSALLDEVSDASEEIGVQAVIAVGDQIEAVFNK